jgi:mannosyltransferase OCH1-like enzyme
MAPAQAGELLHPPRCNATELDALSPVTIPTASHAELRTLERAGGAGAPAGAGIPPIIWHTAKAGVGTPARLACTLESWRRWNPDWATPFLDDAAMFDMLARDYGAPFMARFRELPLGVMRSDFFRCAPPCRGR